MQWNIVFCLTEDPDKIYPYNFTKSKGLTINIYIFAFGKNGKLVARALTEDKINIYRTLIILYNPN